MSEEEFQRAIKWTEFGDTYLVLSDSTGRPFDDQYIVNQLIEKRCSIVDVMKLDRFHLLKLFLESNDSLDIDEGYNGGWSALHHATLKEDVELVKLFLEHHADPNKLDNYSFTPVYHLYYKVEKDDNRHERLEILKSLFEHGAVAVTKMATYDRLQIVSVFAFGDEQAVKYGLTLGVDLRARYDRDHNSVLHYLARNKNPNTMTKIRGKDFDVDARNDFRQSPLWQASNFGNIDAIEFLLSEGADVNAADKTNCTPVLAAIRNYKYDCQRYRRCIELLIEHGADVQAVPRDDEPTLFDLLRQYEDNALTKLIIEYLVWQEAAGTKITRLVQYHVNSENHMKNYWKDCRDLLAKKVYESKALLDFRCCSEDKLISYMRNDDLVSVVSDFCEELTLQMIPYGYWLQKRLDKAGRTAALRDLAASVICKLIKIQYNGYSYMVDLILRYLNDQDLINFLNAEL